MGVIGMKQSRILFTGFKKAHKNDVNSSAILLDKISNQFSKFLFTNDYTTIIDEIDKLFEKENYDYVIMFGQKPLIKSLSVEVICKNKNSIIKTNFPLKKLLDVLKENNIAYKISQNPGTSYCNFAYYNVLKCLEAREWNTKVIFIHVPCKDNFRELEKFVKVINQ